MADLGFLKERIGPLPAGAWLAVVGGGLAIGYVGRRRKAGASTATAIPTIGQADAKGFGSLGSASFSGSTGMGTPKAATNEEWIRMASDNLIGRGFLADKVSNALNRIFHPSAGNQPTIEDTSIYNAATIAIGAPPQLPSGYLATPAPAGYDPTSFYGAATPGRVATPTTAQQGTYFGLAGSGVAIDPNDPTIGKYGEWQQGVFTTPPAGYRDYVLGVLKSKGVAV